MKNFRTVVGSIRALALLAAFVLLAGAATVAAVQSDAQQGSPTPGQAPSAPPSPDPDVSAPSRFQGLRRGTSSPDSALTSMLRSHGQDPASASVGSARIGGARIDAAVGGDAACLKVVGPDGSGSAGCSTARSAGAEATPILSVDKTPSGYRVSGLLPDSVGDVRVTTSAGDVLRGDITNNLFSVEVATSPQLVSWRGAGGAAFSQRVSG